MAVQRGVPEQELVAGRDGERVDHRGADRVGGGDRRGVDELAGGGDRSVELGGVVGGHPPCIRVLRVGGEDPGGAGREVAAHLGVDPEARQHGGGADRVRLGGDGRCQIRHIPEACGGVGGRSVAGRENPAGQQASVQRRLLGRCGGGARRPERSGRRVG